MNRKLVWLISSVTAFLAIVMIYWSVAIELGYGGD